MQGVLPAGIGRIGYIARQKLKSETIVPDYPKHPSTATRRARLLQPQ